MSDLKKQTGEPGLAANTERETAHGASGTAGIEAACTEAANVSVTRLLGIEREAGAAIEARMVLPGAGGVAPMPAKITYPDQLELQAWNAEVCRRMPHQTRRSFLGLGAGLVAGCGTLGWLTSRREIDGLPWPFRKTLGVNEQLWRDFFSQRRISPGF